MKVGDKKRLYHKFLDQLVNLPTFKEIAVIEVIHYTNLNGKLDIRDSFRDLYRLVKSQ